MLICRSAHGSALNWRRITMGTVYCRQFHLLTCCLTLPQFIVNGTSNKYEIKSTPNKTSLTINDLNIESDVGDYTCSGTSEIGTATDNIHLRVRSRWAALWPFLGIVAEVIILVTIIFIYEKRRKPDEINDGAYWMFCCVLGCGCWAVPSKIQ